MQTIVEEFRGIDKQVTNVERAGGGLDHSAGILRSVGRRLGCVAGGATRATAIGAMSPVNRNLPRGAKLIHTLRALPIGQLEVICAVSIEIATQAIHLSLVVVRDGRRDVRSGIVEDFEAKVSLENDSVAFLVGPELPIMRAHGQGEELSIHLY